MDSLENPKALRSEINYSFEFFPSEIIAEILSRLPVKVLGRCTAVSKLWYSIITSPVFITTHIKNYSTSVANTAFSSQTPCANIMLTPTVIKELEKHSYSLFFDNTFVKHGSFDIPMVYHWLEISYIGNSCNGIICFADKKSFFGREVFLLNPSIKKLKIISYDCYADAKYDRRKVFSKLGFGFCECTNDYKVVRIHYIKDANSRKLGNLAPEVEVYSLNAERWRRISANVKCLVNYRSVSCNGSIYWLARSWNEGVFDTIMSFDIAHEVFCEIGLPVKCNSMMDGTILVYKGLLALFKDASGSREEGGARCYELWVMEEYNEPKSWIKQSSLETKNSVMKVFGFTMSGKLVMEMHCNMLASWDPEKNNLEHLNIVAFLYHVDTAFVESLVLYEGGNIASADTKAIVAKSSQSMRIMKSQELLLDMDIHKIQIHGDVVMVRIAADLAMVNRGVNELKILCGKRQPALVGIMARPHDVPSNLRICVENYCLIIQQDHLDQVRESLREFLAIPDICFMRVGPDRLYASSDSLRKKDIEFGDLVYRVLKKHYIGKFGLKPLADDVGIYLETCPFECNLERIAEGFSEENIKWVIYQVYSSYKIACKLMCSL